MKHFQVSLYINPSDIGVNSPASVTNWIAWASFQGCQGAAYSQ